MNIVLILILVCYLCNITFVKSDVAEQSRNISSRIVCNISKLDPDDELNYCHTRYRNNNLERGDYCLLRPELVRPTQIFIGRVEMECTKLSIESKDSNDLRELIMDHQIPTIIGPDKKSNTDVGFYITDHHHFALALFEAFLDFKRPHIHRLLYACIQENYDNMTEKNFWRMMKDEQLVFLEDEYGNQIDIDAIPKNLKSMTDNPYRTFASWLRKSYAFIKCGTKNTGGLPQCMNQTAQFFIECYWADHIRKKFPFDNFKIPPDNYTVVDDFIYNVALQLQSQALQSILRDGITYAISDASRSMPGYNQDIDKLPPKMVDLDKYGCT